MSPDLPLTLTRKGKEKMKRTKIFSLLCLLALLLPTLCLVACNEGNSGTPADTGDAPVGGSEFNLEEWAGEYVSELQSTLSESIPSNYVIPVRAEGEKNDSPAIKRALEKIKDTGGCLFFPESNYVIDEPIVIYKNITYLGRGVGQTTITVEKGANCDAFVTHLFDSYKDQKHYDDLISAYFGPNSELPQNFEIRGLTIDGNANFKIENSTDLIYKATGNTEGNGIRIFGKRYIIEDVQIQNVAQIGFYTEFNSPEETGVDKSYNYFICTKIDGLRVISTGEEGLVYRGPSDQEVDGLWVCASCLTGQSTLYKNYTNWELAAVVFEDKDSLNGNTSYCASPEIGFAHIWRGYNCWGMVLLGQLRFKADHVIIESTFGGLKTSTTCYSQISILDVHNCMYGDNTRPYIYLRSTLHHTKISNLEVRYGYDQTQKDMIWITGNNVTIGECQLRANYDIRKENAGGHGVVISGNYNQITGLNAMQFAGVGADGKTASAIVLSGTRNVISGVVSESSVGATVTNPNNTLSLTTRTDTSKGQVAVSGSASHLTSMNLTLLDYNAATSTWTKYPTQALNSSAFNATSTQVQTVKIKHGSTITPAFSNVQLTLTNPSALTDFSLDYLTVVAIDDTYVTVQLRLNQASATANSKLGVSISIGN